jgi:hypothetical protein
MKNSQVVNLNEDSVVAFDGDDIIDDTTQLPIGLNSGITSISVDLSFLDLMTGAVTTVANKLMTYKSLTDFWTVDVADIKSSLNDRRKYVARVLEVIGGSANMRPFKVLEFAVDNDSFESTWMRLPYEVVVLNNEAWIVWYEDGKIGQSGYEKFKAPAYQGGTGTEYATDPSKVTHRGAIVSWS